MHDTNERPNAVCEGGRNNKTTAKKIIHTRTQTEQYLLAVFIFNAIMGT